ncbi:MAG: hypothetical protein B7Z41_02825, partial [Rhizobiales bacterium 12-66-7]
MRKGEEDARPVQLTLACAFGALYFSLGIYMPFFSLWLIARGLDPDEIGVALAVPLVTRLIATPILGLLSDRIGRPKAILMWLALASSLMMGALAFSHGTLAIYVVLGITAMAWNPSFSLLDAYATGLNTYAKAHPREVKLGKLFPVDGLDIATGFALRQPFFFGLDRVIAPLAEGEDPAVDFGPVFDPSKPGNPPPLTPLGEGSDDNGSNAFAIAPSRTGDGTTRLVSNTHQPWRGPVAWYELVVESDEGWHYAGATFPGAPFPLLGHNETLGWTNTVNRPDIIDAYRLVLDPSGTKYRLDGKWHDLERRDIVLPVKLGPITLPIRRTVWRSEHGPVVKGPKGAFAIRYGGMGGIGQLEEYFRLNKARDYAEWRAALAMQAVPSTNFIYADAAGNIAYHYNAAIPERISGPDWRRVLPGDRSDLIWRSMVPFEKIPFYLNPASGFLWNANNTPFAAAGPSDLSLASVPPEYGVELTMTNRARRAQKLFAQIDGAISLPALERIKYDTGWERAGYVAQMLDGIAALDVSDEPLLAKAQKLLGEWDYTS